MTSDQPVDHTPPTLDHVMSSLRTQLGHLDRLTGPEAQAVHRELARLVRPEVHAAESAVHRVVPAWKRATEGEHRLPVASIMLLAIALQLGLPSHLALGPRWILPALEAGVLVGLVAANPRRIDRASTAMRSASVSLIALASVANAWSSGRLIEGLINGTEGENAAHLLAAGASIYLTNVIVFSLWYWEWDRKGPVARANAERLYPDFLFPQMATPEAAAPDWRPTFLDYLYLSFTNATAFSPTDTMPMVLWAKMLMLLQSAVALVTIGLVIARAVNILK